MAHFPSNIIGSNPQQAITRLADWFEKHPIITTAANGALLKMIGSLFRIADDLQAPKDIRDTTVRRELMLVSLVTACTASVALIYDSIIKPRLKPGPILQKSSQFLLVAIGYVASEKISRIIAPKPSWKSLKGGNVTQPTLPSPPVAGSRLNIEAHPNPSQVPMDAQHSHASSLPPASPLTAPHTQAVAYLPLPQAGMKFSARSTGFRV